MQLCGRCGNRKLWLETYLFGTVVGFNLCILYTLLLSEQQSRCEKMNTRYGVSLTVPGLFAHACIFAPRSESSPWELSLPGTCVIQNENVLVPAYLLVVLESGC